MTTEMSVGRLSKKIAVITGAASGIGRATCIRFAEEYANIVAIDKNADGLNQTLSLLNKDKSLKHLSFCGDISDTGFANQVFKDVNKKVDGKKSSILVNCAGITRDNFLLKMSPERFDEVIRINLKGVFVMTKEFAKSLELDKSDIEPCSIVNVSSIVGKTGNIGQANYSASKAGVIGLTKTTGIELAKFGIRCNAILPGFVSTPMTDVVPRDVLNKFLDSIPMQRMGTPEEIANVSLFLASEESSYINCATLEVTGGLLA